VAQPTYQYRSSPLRELLTERRAPAGEAESRGLFARFPVTATIMTVILIVYAIEGQLGGSDDVSVQIRLGAVRQDLIFEKGEYYRLLCAAFLHGGFIHLAFNGLAFFQLGILCELIYGRWRTLAVYLLSAIAAPLSSATFLPLPSVGASGAILGLAGLLLGTSWYGAEPWRTDLRHLLGRRLLYAVLLTFALGLGLQLLWLPVIDNYGHLGGLVTGMVMAGIHRRAGAPAGPGLRALATALTLATAIAFGWMAVDGVESAASTEDDLVLAQARLMEGDPRLVPSVAPLIYAYYLEAHVDAEAEAVARRWHQHLPDDPQAQNALAWFLLTRPQAEQRDPQAALPLADAAVRSVTRAVEAAWGSAFDELQTLAALLDTRALALRGVGRLEEAREDEERAEGIWRRVIRELPSQEAAVLPMLYQSYQRAGDQRAWPTLGRWLQLTPGDDRALRPLADRVAGSGRWPAQQVLILVDATLGDLEAAEAANSLLGRYRLAALLGCRGRVLRQLGRADEARTAERRALGTLAPEQAPQLRRRLAAQLER
jgi:rhomboid protease GluP